MNLWKHPWWAQINLRNLRSLGPTGLLGLFWMTMPAIAGLYLLYELGAVSEWLQARPTTGILLYALVFALASGTGLLPTTAQAVLGGWVFGATFGMIAASFGFAGGALLGMIITRWIARHQVEKWLLASPRASAVRDALVGKTLLRTTGMIALLRLPPQAPFAFMNLLIVSSGVRTIPFILGTLIGMAPRTFLVISLASAAAQTGARDIQAFVKDGPGWGVAVLGVVALLIVLSIIGKIARHALRHQNINWSTSR